VRLRIKQLRVMKSWKSKRLRMKLRNLEILSLLFLNIHSCILVSKLKKKRKKLIKSKKISWKKILKRLIDKEYYKC